MSRVSRDLILAIIRFQDLQILFPQGSYAFLRRLVVIVPRLNLCPNLLVTSGDAVWAEKAGETDLNAREIHLLVTAVHRFDIVGSSSHDVGAYADMLT
jgi:hypothetical protein